MKFKKPLIFCFLSILFSVYGQAQDVTVSGKVIDENGLPIPGVSILIKGTSKATASDMDGNYQIKAASNGTLVYSYIGYGTEQQPINGRTRIEVRLSLDTQALQEVVVVGYGSQKKADVTGAVAKVDLERAKAIPTTNVSEMLRGQAAGVQITLTSARPGGTSNILIRGRKSIRGGNDPLIVLDGFPIENINDVTPDDIASVEVLKDASAQAIYGARASNGVILITSKKGKEGKMRVNFNSYTNIQQLTKNFDLYSPEEYAQFRREADRTDQPVANQTNPDGTPKYRSDVVIFGGAVTALEYQNFSNPSRWTNWEDTVLSSGVTNSQTLSVQGGTDKTKIYSSINYYDQSGLIPSSGYKRGTFRINVDQKINDSASFEANINVSSDKQQVESSNLDFIAISPFANPYDTNGNLIKNLAGANASSSAINPLWNIRESANDKKTDFYNLNLVGNYKLSKNFSYKLNTMFGRRFTDTGQYISKLHSAGVTPNGSATVSSTLREEYLVENILNYKGQINENHRFDATFVQSVNQRNTSQTTSTGTNFGNDILGYDGITNALIFKVVRNEEQYRLASFLGRARYTLMDKYLFTFTVRRDGASVFSENQKWGTFPAASVAWQMHKESFLKNVKSIDQLKLRASYGSVGNQSLDPYTTLGVVGNFPYVYGGAIVGGALPGTVLPNPNLTWETSTTSNYGMDFGLFDNRITGSLDIYDTHTTDLLTDISLGGTSGFSSMITNGGESKNSGYEVLLTGNIIRKKDLNLSLTAVYTHNENELIKSGIADVNGAPKEDRGRGRYIGQPINVYRTMVFDGIFQTDAEALASPQANPLSTTNAGAGLALLRAGSIKLKDINGDGIVNDSDNVFIDPNPKWYGSLAANLEYKNFELLVDLYTVQGITKSNPYLSAFNGVNTFSAYNNAIKLDYFTPEHPSANYPRPNSGSGKGPANLGALSYVNADYIRLRTLSLGYNLPSDVLSKLKLNNFKVYVTANNLFTWTDYLSYSPENNPNDFPDTKSITLGLNIGL